MKNLSAASFLSVTLIGSAVSGFVSLALIDASIKSVVLLLLAAITCFALTRASAATRHLVWAATMLGLLLMPACALLLPDWRVLPEWLSWENRIEMEESKTQQLSLGSSAAIDAPELVNPSGNATLPRSDVAFSSTIQTYASMPNTSDVVSPTPELNPSSLLYAPIQVRLPASIVIGLWAAGCLVCLFPAIVSFFRLRSLERKCRKNGTLSAKTVSRIKKIACRLGVAVPRILVGPAGTMPMVWSFGRPRILLPSDMNRWSEAKTKAVLLHELIHLRRHDPVVCSLGLIARALNWFNPLAWYAVHRLRMECEQACDDQVLQQGMEASDYAGHLLELSTFVRYESKTLPLAMAMATKPGIETRIASILNESQDRRGVTTARVFAMFAAVSIGVAILASTATRGVKQEKASEHGEQVFDKKDAVENKVDNVIDANERIAVVGEDSVLAGDLFPAGKLTPEISADSKFEMQLRKLLYEVITRKALAQRFINDKVAGKPLKDRADVRKQLKTQTAKIFHQKWMPMQIARMNCDSELELEWKLAEAGRTLSSMLNEFSENTWAQEYLREKLPEPKALEPSDLNDEYKEMRNVVIARVLRESEIWSKWPDDIPGSKDITELEKDSVENEIAVVSDDVAEPQLDKEPSAKQSDVAQAAHKSNQGELTYVDLSLEECIAHALINAQVVRIPNAWQPMDTTHAATSVSPHGLETTSQSDVVDQNGCRIRARGAAREGLDENVAVALKEVDDRRNAFSGNGQDSTKPKTSTTHARPQLVNRIPVVLTRINDDVSVGQYEERVCNLVRDIEFAYWDLYAAYFNRDAARTAMDSAAITYKMTQARFKTVGQAANGEAQARVTFHQFKAQLDATLAGEDKTNEPGLIQREQKLRLLMGWAANEGHLIRPSDKPATGLISFDWESVKKETLTRNIDLRQQAHEIKQRELELMSAKNQAMAEPNQNPIARPSAFEELFGGNIQEGGVRMEFNPNPFGSRRALNDVQNKQLSLAREHRIREAKEIAAINKLSSLWQQVDSLRKQMTDQFQALNAAQTLVEVSQAKFDAGDFGGNPDAAIDNLLRAQQTRSTASQNYTRAVTEYNKSLVEVHAIKGSLLEYNNLKLQDGLPLCP